MVSLIGMGAVTALITFACAGRIETSARKLLSHTLQAALLTLSLTLLGTYLMPPYQSSAAIFPSLRIEQRVGERIFLPGDSIPEAEPHKDDVVARIQETGVLRVGYHSGIAPYVYFNEWGELVGHDVALIHNFARAVGVRIDWIPFDYVSLVDDLLAHRFDIAVGSVSVTEGRLTQIDFTAPYSEQELVLVVRDHARHEFYTQEQIHARANLRMAALKGSSTLEILRTMFPQKTILPASSMDILLEDPSIDAYLQTHWEAFTWALTHPQYSIVAPSPSLGMEHLAIAITPNAPELTRLTSYWLEMQRKSGELEQLKHTWVEGRIVNDEPRWSIIRDVLHWVD
jgi:ABC-type amino acid transport substrate-binding protein